MTLRLSILRWLLTLVGVQFLCAILWVLGPLVDWLEPATARLAAILLLLITWAAANLALDWRRTRRESVLAEGLTGAAQDEAAALRDRLAQALILLRKTRGRRTYLYDQPWYAIIGPPGAGKTTALLNAGLEFPLAETLGPGAVSGVGGTRLCEWWFTGAGVLIDTAGRYTTQDSNAAVDRAGWQAFLALLRRTRPKQPLNGLLVAIALDDACAPDTAHAQAIRARIDELDTAFGTRLPVYALLTKADRLAGFSEFFSDLDRSGREQIWGATFPLNDRPPSTEILPPAPRPPEPSTIPPSGHRTRPRAPRRHRRLPRPIRQHRRPNPGFPGPHLRRRPHRPNSAAPRRLSHLRDAGRRPHRPSHRRPRPRLRPRPTPRRPLAPRSRPCLLPRRPPPRRRLPRSPPRLLPPRRRPAPQDAPTGRLRRLRHPGARRNRHPPRPPLRSPRIHRRRADQLGHQQQRAATLTLDPVAEADFARLLPWLDAASPPITKPVHNPTRFAPTGFDQDDKLAAGRTAAYRHALENALLPRLVWRAEEQVRGRLGQPDTLYEALRVYLMLGGAGPLDRTSVSEWFARDWAATLPAENLQTLNRHLAALLEGALPPIPLDGPLIEQARATIGRVPLAARGYARLKTLSEAAHPAPWIPGQALGPAGMRVFLRRSGAGLEQGISGLFTAAGARQSVLPALPAAAQTAAAESWVSGEKIDPTGPQRATLEHDMLQLYAADYIVAWEAMLADLELSPLRSLTQATQDLFILASPHSPIRSVLAAATRELAPGAALPAENPSRTVLTEIDDRFRPLRAVFGTGGAAPIDQVLRPLGDLEQQLAKQAASGSKTAAPLPGEDPALALKSEALRQPPPLSRWLVDMAIGGAALRTGGPRGAMIAAWNAGGGPGSQCQAAISKRYPFDPNATADISLEDFTRLFGPGGAIDAFFNAHLKPYVDMTPRPWRLQPVDGVNAPVTPPDLAQFQRAAAIRDLFFPAGSTQPSLRFDLAPGALDPQVTSVRLELGTAALVGSRDTFARPAALTWPGRPAATSARLTLAGAPPATLETTGPWAVFRLLAQARATSAGDRITLAFTASDRQARFELRATPNPFGTPLLTDFRCPTVQ